LSGEIHNVATLTLSCAHRTGEWLGFRLGFESFREEIEFYFGGKSTLSLSLPYRRPLTEPLEISWFLIIYSGDIN